MPVNRSEVALSVRISRKTAPTVAPPGVARAQAFATVTPLLVASWAEAVAGNNAIKLKSRNFMRMTTPPKRIPARDIGQAQPIGHAHYPHISVAASTGLTSGDGEYDNVEAS